MIITLLQIIVALLLIGVVLLQVQGSGISSTFGGAGEFYRSKRSIERMLIWFTIVLTIFFAVLSIAALILH